MAKKIYDIKPPKMTRKVEKPAKEIKKIKKPAVITIERKSHVAPTVERKVEKKKKGHPILITVSIIILAVVVYLFFKLPKAEIIIWPKVETLSFQQAITADKSFNAIDESKLVIPAKYFESTKTVEQEFPSTGIAIDAGKAYGIITVYNKYNPPAPLSLRSGTHFMSDSGKLFISSKKIVVPAATKSGSKIIPGSIKVDVTAVEAGTDYNISSSNFSVPGLKGTAYYYSIYASSSEDMIGGYTGKVKKVTNEDLDGAKDILIEKATADSVAEIKSQITEEYVLLENAILSEVVDGSTKTKAGAVAENFTYSVTVKTNALVFKKSDIDEFAKNYILSKSLTGKTILEPSYKVDYVADLIDISGGKINLNLNFSSGVYQDVDKNSMEIALFGQTPDQVKQTINNQLGDQVLKVEIKLWPFWVSSTPKNQKAVNVDLKF